MFLYKVLDALDREGVGCALVGGFALALHGIVRATVDVDLVLTLRLQDYQKAEKALTSIGLKSRLPITAKDIILMREEFIDRRNLIAWSFVDHADPTRQVDILITENLAKIKTEQVRVAGRKIKVAALSELLRMKRSAGRPQDLVDIDKIMELMNENKK